MNTKLLNSLQKILKNGRYYSVERGTIGFVGLGVMGTFMAENLLKNNKRLLVHDIDTKKAKHLTKLGAEKAINVEHLAQCKNIITMIRDNEESENLYIKQGLLKHATNVTFIDTSTISPELSIKLSQKARENNCVYLDSPVSGASIMAKNAKLTFLVGGDPNEIDSIKRILQCMGENIINCGPTGTGMASKLTNNMLLAISMIGTSEAMLMGTRLGIKPAILYKIINNSSGRCWSSELYNPFPGLNQSVPSSHDYKDGFASLLMLKDLTLAMEAAKQTNTDTPLASKSHSLYKTLVEKTGNAERDFSVIFEYLSNKK